MVLRKPSRPSQTIFDFARLSRPEQIELLRTCGILLDTDFENDKFIHLYFLNGYFVEVTISPSNNGETAIIPFRQGYRMRTYIRQQFNKDLTADHARTGSGGADFTSPCMN
jgi:hypothetical protein